MLVAAARQLFARRGVDNTTMIDIAKTAGKSRRTLYQYFKNKEEVYLAVIETESEILSDTMRRVAEQALPPEVKVMKLIYTHLDAVRGVVSRNGNLRANFFRDNWVVEGVRKHFDANEVYLFREVLREGVEKGTFHIEDINMTAEIIHYSVKGLEVPYIQGRVGNKLDEPTRDRYVSRMVLTALGYRFKPE